MSAIIVLVIVMGWVSLTSLFVLHWLQAAAGECYEASLYGA